MTMVANAYAFTLGTAGLAHRRFVGSPRTICGYRVATTSDNRNGRRDCPRCAVFLR